MIKIDLKHAYYSVNTASESRKLLSFTWNGTLYEYTSLVFGLGPAPRMFTKLLKVPITVMRKINIRIVHRDWGRMFPYAFPPFNLIGQTLKKVKKHSIDMILVTPVWGAQPWYPQLLGMTIRNPIMLPQTKTLLSNPQGETHHLLKNNSLKMAAWLISGKQCKIQAFQSQLPNLSSVPGVQAQEAITTHTGNSSLAGVVKNKLIHFAVL